MISSTWTHHDKLFYTIKAIVIYRSLASQISSCEENDQLILEKKERHNTAFFFILSDYLFNTSNMKRQHKITRIPRHRVYNFSRTKSIE